jgi:Tfp pilus assembly protein PilO
MNFLNKIQQWPERRKKFLLLIIVIILAILLLKFYVADIQKKIGALEGEKLKEQFPTEKLETELYKGKEKLKEWGEELKKLYENLLKNEEKGNKSQ